MLKHTIVFAICFGFAINSYSQKLTINGYVNDSTSGEHLPGASIYDLTNKSGTNSNFYGYYNLTVQKGEISIVTKVMGFQPDTLKLMILKDTTINIHLHPVNTQLEEVVVSSSRDEHLDISQTNKITLSKTDVEAMPRLAGEVDVVKAIQMLPGVKAGREGSSDYYVRGGGPDQNLILIDGVPIYHSSHALGFFSVFNTDAIKNIDLLKGGFPSRYGGRLSSVLDIQLKDGNQNRLRYEVSAGLISSKLLIEGPVKSENTTFLFAARRTYLDILAAIAQPKKSGRLNYNFYDLNGKLSHRFSARDKVYFSIYSGSDKFTSKPSSSQENKNERNSLNWGNVTSAMRYNHLFSNKLFSNLVLTYTNYKFKTESEYTNKQKDENYLLSYYSKIQDAGLKLDFDYLPSNDHFIRFGANTIFHEFSPNVTRLKKPNDQSDRIDTSFNGQPIKGLEYYIYAEDEWKLTERFQANLGFHLSGFLVQGKRYLSPQPRLSLNYQLSNNTSIRSSYALMTQYVHLLSNPGTGSPTDIWVPSSKKIKPQESWQTTIGLAKTLHNNRYELSIDGFYKNMTNVIEYAQGVNFLEEGLESNLLNEASTSWEEKIESGKGTSYGAEFFLRKKEGRLTGWAGYTLSWASRNFDAINSGRAYPFKYDSRHNISVTSSYKINKRIEVSANWVYYTGTPTTLPLTEYQYYSQNNSSSRSIDNVNVRNNFRMSDYHRLDAGIAFIKEKKLGQRSWNISIYNLYNRKNPYYISSSQTSRSGKTSVYQYSLLPIVPSVSYSYKLK